MPTTFTTIANGDPLDPAGVNQFGGPINALETLLGSLSAIELGYLLGVTSGIQAQINGKAATSHTHTISQLSDWPGGLTVTELGYLDGVTSSIQAQFTGKSDTIHNHTITALTGWPGGLTTTELGYLDGVTSAIQAQLDAKAALSHAHAASDITSGILAIARGGTGLGALGTALQAIRVNAGATALEYYTPSGGGGATDLDGLSDVVITSPVAGNLVRHNGTNFVNANLVPGDMPAAPYVRAFKSAGQSISGSYAENLAVFGSIENNDCFAYFDGTWTCTVAGNYQISWSIYYPNSYDCWSLVKVNNVIEWYGLRNVAYNSPGGSFNRQLSVGDTVKVFIHCANGPLTDWGSENVRDKNNLSMVRIGA